MLLRNLFRMLGRGAVQGGILTDRVVGDADRHSPPYIQLYARFVPEPEEGTPTPGPLAGRRQWSQLTPAIRHRARLLSMRLEHLQLCSPHRCRRLAQLRIITAGDLAGASPRELAAHFRAPRRAERVLTQYRRAIRLAASVPDMTPREAMLLIHVHRRSTRGLARDSAPGLHRDLERYAQSSQGQRLLRGRRIPSTRRIKRWITECQQLAASTA